MSRNETSLTHFNWNSVRKRFTCRETLKIPLSTTEKMFKPSIRSRFLVFSISVLSVWCIIYFIFLWKTCIEKGRTFKGCILSFVQRVRKLARRASQYKDRDQRNARFGYRSVQIGDLHIFGPRFQRRSEVSNILKGYPFSMARFHHLVGSP